jgi:hypothetical protein
MEKYKLINLVKKTGRSFKNQNPTGVYKKVLNNSHYSPLSHVLDAKDLVLFSFLVPRFNMNFNIEEDYDIIEYDMFTVELVKVYDSSPTIDCSECRGGYTPCDNCNGRGEEECRRCDNTGEEYCDTCDGSGVDEEGDTCYSCEGSGRITCGSCNGSGEESCNYCGGDGEVQCGYCGGSGEMDSENSSEITYFDFISWSEPWKQYFSSVKHGDQVDSEDSNNFFNNDKTIILRDYSEISDEYQEFDEDDVILFRMNEKSNFKLLRDNNTGEVIIY